MSHIKELINKYCSNGVKYASLGELGNFYGGLSGKNKLDFENGNAKWVTYSNIYSNLAVDLNINDYVKVGENEKQNYIQKGDILFTGSSETREESGIASVVTIEPTEKIYLNSFCFGFRLNDPSILLPDYCKYLFRTPLLRNQIIKTASGVTRFNVSKKKMESVKIPLPNLELQKEIANRLDKFYYKNKEYLKCIEQEIEYRKVLTDKIIGKIVISINDGEEVTLRDIVDFKNGKGHEKNIVSEGKYIVVNSKFISTNGRVKKYSDEQICPLIKDDILMVMSDLPNGKALSKCFLVDKDDTYTLNQRIGCFHIKNDLKILPEYLTKFLNRNKQLLEYDNGIDQTNLRKDDILDIAIIIPSLEKQKEIIEKINGILSINDELIELMEKEFKNRTLQSDALLKEYFDYKEVK